MIKFCWALWPPDFLYYTRLWLKIQAEKLLSGSLLQLLRYTASPNARRTIVRLRLR